MERGLRDIIETDDPDLIIGDAFAAEEAVRAVAADYPDTAFAFGSGCEEQAPNFSVFDNWMQDPGYLAGMLAGGLTESDTIGVVAAMPIPEVNRIVNAFVDGRRRDERRRHGQRVVHQLVLRPGDGGAGSRGADRPGRRRAVRRACRRHRGRRRERPAGRSG